MRHRLTASALFALTVFATLAPGRPQPDPKPKADPKPAPKADPTDAAIAAALANDPEVRITKAKVQMADAELAKARQAVTLKVVTLKGKMDQLRADVRTAEARVARFAQLVEVKSVESALLDAERDRLEAAKTGLALAETEWKLLTGGASGAGATGAAPDPNHDRAAALGLAWLSRHQKIEGASADETASLLAYLMAAELSRGKVATGPIPERIRAALDKPVKLGAKGEKVTFEKALEVFKRVGLDVPVRGRLPLVEAQDPKDPNEIKAQPLTIVSEGEELPVGAWFQLFEDSATFAHSDSRQTVQTVRYRFYVREYGLFISRADTAPPDAPPITEFWKQKPPAKEAKPEPKVEPLQKK